jgi:hypothetical protein
MSHTCCVNKSGNNSNSNSINISSIVHLPVADQQEQLDKLSTTASLTATSSTTITHSSAPSLSVKITNTIDELLRLLESEIEKQNKSVAVELADASKLMSSVQGQQLYLNTIFKHDLQIYKHKRKQLNL